MATMFAVPERTTRQRFEALERANEIRVYRARVKRDLKEGRVSLLGLLDDPGCGTMRVREALLAVPRFGEKKAARVLFKARVSPSCQLENLTDRQRAALLQCVMAYPSGTAACLAA